MSDRVTAISRATRHDGSRARLPAAREGREKVGWPRAELAARSGVRLMTWVSWWMLAGYLVLVGSLMIVLSVRPSLDLFLVLGAAGFVGLARNVPIVRDWGPFLLLLVAWEGMRSVANAFGAAVQSDAMIAIERALFGGTLPTLELQRALFAGTPGPHDVGLTFVYVSHFVFPVTFAFLLWRAHRPTYYRFVTTMIVVSFTSFFTFLLLPVAPPRFAAAFGEAIPVVDVMAAVSRSIDWPQPAWMYQNLVGNPVAAFPSMHAGYAFLVLLFLRERSARLAFGWLAVTVAIWFATVYLGHHYVVDVIGGAAYALAGYVIVRRLMSPGRGRTMYPRAAVPAKPLEWG